MKKMNDKKRYLFSTVLAASLLFGSITPAYAEIKLGELGDENNQIAAPAAGFSYSSDVVALDDLGISVTPSDYVSIQQVDGFVYIYTQETDYIPYVIVGYYDLTADDFASQFTQYMSDSYEDLQVMSPEAAVTLGDQEYTYIQYAYSVSGYTVRDSRGQCGRNYFRHRRFQHFGQQCGIQFYYLFPGKCRLRGNLGSVRRWFPLTESHVYLIVWRMATAARSCFSILQIRTMYFVWI